MNVWSRACLPVTHFTTAVEPSLTTGRPRMPAMHARTACTAYATRPRGSENERGEGTLCPCHVSLSFAQRFLQKVIDVTVIGVRRSCLVSVADFRKKLVLGPALPRGAAVCTATATVNAWTTSSIIYRCLDHGCSVGNVYRFVALDTT